MDENKALWKKCVEFHGHECGGLTIGYKASLYAIALLGLGLGGGGNAGCLSADEEVVCISENDACGVDANKPPSENSELLTSLPSINREITN